MSEVSQALQKIARGTGIIFAGTVVSMLFGFLSRMIIARYFSTGEYGVFNLALTVLSIALVIATLGFQNSLPREVAVYREREPSRVKALISTALIIVAVNSLVLTVLLVILSGEISLIFHDERLLHALKVVAFALPFSALTGVIISTTQGFGRVREKVYFQNIIRPAVWLALVSLMAFLNLPLSSIFWVYVLTQAATFSAMLLEVFRIGILTSKAGFHPNREIGVKLVKFSVPLMLTGIAGFIMTWTDTLMLGYYESSDVVGLYNAAAPLARLLPVFLNSAAFLYPPIISQLYVQRKMSEMKRTYQILTKWIFLLTLPLFSVMFLFPEATISFLFGSKYVSTSSALQILALGFMFHTFLGLNGLSLLVIGESKFIMVSGLVSAVFNVILNAFLIPIYGMEGAAVATAVSYFIGNVLSSLKLYKETKIHPFSWNYVKPLVISFVLLGIIQTLNLNVPNVLYAIPVLFAFLLVYFFLVLLSRSVDKEDVELFLAIERKLGIDAEIIKKILRRFV
ncbi:flippase [Thermococcus stetteri]|uniref:flippase n=1 Tax=Thermococcus stetteri TaxID=49900 RepID=UPI001AE5B1DB|nr:flippase [Thermococcus stetteri]MBP1911662.1 O-antigen/teichoic acid export membrane protein [Thermococcus stetteri]